MPKKPLFTAGHLILALTTFWATAPAWGADDDGIRPYSGNPYYWQYKGKPIMLLDALPPSGLARRGPMGMGHRAF